MDMQAVPDSARAAVEAMTSALQAQLGDALISLSLVGSVLGEAYCPKRSDVNSVLVVREQTAALLDFLSSIGPTMGRRRLAAPLLMQPSYIERSCDVFAVEWLDFQWRHHTVTGPDPFADLAFGKNDVRLHCEREYKSALVRLRQGYIGSAGKPAVIGHLLASAGRELLPYLRATLWLEGLERPATAAGTFERIGQLTDVSPAALAERYAGRYATVRLTAATARAAFWQTCQAIEALADRVDQLEV